MVYLGSFTTILTLTSSANLPKVAVSPVDGAVYAGGDNGVALVRSPTGTSGTFVIVDDGVAGNFGTLSIGISPVNGAVYCGTVTGSVFSSSGLLRRSTTGLSATFSNVDSLYSVSTSPLSIAVSPIDGAVYVLYSSGTTDGQGARCQIRRSATGTSGTFSTVYGRARFNGNVGDLYISPIDGAVYVIASFTDFTTGVIVAKSPTGASGTFIENQISLDISVANKALISNSGGKLFIAGKQNVSPGYTTGKWGVWRSSNLLSEINTTSRVSGAIGFNTKRKLMDLNNVELLNSFDYFSNKFNSAAVFGPSANTKQYLQSPVMKMSISGVSEPFNANSIQIRFREDTSSTAYTDLSKLGMYVSASSEPGWVNFSYDFSYNPPPSMSFVSTETSSSLVISSSAGKIYAFKNIRLEFKQSLTNDGVVFYKNVDNDNNKEIFSYIKPSGRTIT